VDAHPECEPLTPTGGAVDGDEEIELAFGGLYLGDVDMEEANRVGPELLLRRLVTPDVGQTADAMALQTAMQGRTRQMRDGGLEGVSAVVER
jgi:hypothetical protein